MRVVGVLLLAWTFAAADTVVLRDRTVLRGAAEAAAAGQSVTISGEAHPLDEVLL